MDQKLILAAKRGAGQQELLELAVAAGVGLYDLPAIVAQAARARDLRETVAHIAELNWTAPPNCKRLSGAIESARSMIVQLAPPDCSDPVGLMLKRWCGDLREIDIVQELLSPPIQAEPVNLRALLATAIAIIAPEPAAPSKTVAHRLKQSNLMCNHNWTPKTLARALAPAGVEPVRLRIEGHAPGIRGYRRIDLERASSEIFGASATH